MATEGPAPSLTQVEAQEGRRRHVLEHHDLHPGVSVLDLGNVEKHKLPAEQRNEPSGTGLPSDGGHDPRKSRVSGAPEEARRSHRPGQHLLGAGTPAVMCALCWSWCLGPPAETGTNTQTDVSSAGSSLIPCTPRTSRVLVVPTKHLHTLAFRALSPQGGELPAGLQQHGF